MQRVIASPRLLRFARNDSMGCHCEERLRDEAISTRRRLALGGRNMMRSWIHFTRGRLVRQARIGLDEAGLKEEHLSRQGFAGPVAMLYRTDGPNEVVRIEGDYRPRAVDSADVVAPDADDPRGGWQTLLANEDVAVAVSRRRQAMPYCYRDMAGGPLYLCHPRRGTLPTAFAPIAHESRGWADFATA